MMLSMLPGLLLKKVLFQIGGITLIQAAKALKQLKGLSYEEKMAVDILSKALEEPAYQIAANAGEEGAVVVEKQRASAISIWDSMPAMVNLKTSSKPGY